VDLPRRVRHVRWGIGELLHPTITRRAATVLPLVALAVLSLGATPSPAFCQDTAHFCGFTVQIPDGWVWNLEDTPFGPNLKIKPRCWCDLLESGHDEYDDVGLWFISQPEYPAVLTCRKETVEEFFGSEEESEWRQAPWGPCVLESGAFPIEGRGWSGLANLAEIRRYYWQGGNAGSRRVFGAIVYGLEGRIMTISFEPEGTGLEWLFFTALISRP